MADKNGTLNVTGTGKVQVAPDEAVIHLSVMVDEGQVTLSGSVHSWSEREAVLGGTRGVDSVVDKLRISP